MSKCVAYRLKQKKIIVSQKKRFFSFYTIETNDKIINHEAFIESNDVKFPLACGEENICYYALSKVGS